VNERNENIATSGDNNYPRSWSWAEDGLRAAGAFVGVDEGPTDYGRRPILVLEIDGQARGIWVTQEALRSQLGDELARRGESDFVVGEPVVVERGAEKKQSAAGRDYWPFKVEFPNAPRRTAAELLGVGADYVGEEPPAQSDEDIPF
jgi:hypothetical protein